MRGTVKESSGCRLTNAEHLIRDGGDITVGGIGSIMPGDCGGHRYATRQLVRRQGETIMQLLDRLDDAIGKAYTEEIYIDEVNG